jgi:hypothetical protein
MITDTAPSALAVQIELLRAAGPTKRAELTRSLSRTVIDLSRRALRQRMPDASETEVLLEWVRLSYGEDLARRVAVRLRESE